MSELLTRIKKDKMIATKDNQPIKKDVLGVLLGELDRNKGARDIDDSVVEKTIKKMVTSITEMINAGRDVEKLTQEKDILNSYLPQRVVASRDDISQLIDVAISNGATSIKDLMALVPTWTSGGLDIDRAIVSSLAKEKITK